MIYSFIVLLSTQRLKTITEYEEKWYIFYLQNLIMLLTITCIYMTFFSYAFNINQSV